MSTLLEINNLTIEFPFANGAVQAVKGLSLHLNKGETLGIVGESGSGKSVTALSVMQLLPKVGKITSGEILFHASQHQTSANLLSLAPTALSRFRGAEIAMIFQEPMTSLNPALRCGRQVTEAIQLHQKNTFDEARKQTIQLFDRVKLHNPERIFNAYPHQLSGGQKQRVMIAMAMSCQPKILIADEPTTALDVTVQKAILDLMRELKAEADLSMLFISHDLGVISEISDRVAVMFQGQIVEEGPVEQVLRAPVHPYTKGLVACRPSLHRKLLRMPTVQDYLENRDYEARVLTHLEITSRREMLYLQNPVLQVNKLVVRYPAKINWLGQPVEWMNAVDNVSFDVFPGETFGVAGESGCGKTTLGKTIARLEEAHSGEVYYTVDGGRWTVDGDRRPPSTVYRLPSTVHRLPSTVHRLPSTVYRLPSTVDLQKLSEEVLRPYRRDIQVVFQDPYASLNPRMTIGEAITEPMKTHGLFENDRTRCDKTVELLKTVGLEADHYGRYPHEFSGGQRQRIGVARALAVEPKILICDEIVSSLDVSVQATVLNLLMELQEKFGLTYLFISHDLSVVKQMCDRLLVMNQGKIEALGFPEQLFDKPENEYVRRLIEAVPNP